jgi:uncharacterized membrane protein HdeD (DUF308 family)
MSTNTSSEGPSTADREPATPETVSRAWGFVRIFWGVAAIVVGLIGVFFFFMIPMLLLVLIGIPLVISGARGFGKGKERLASGPGRYE